MEAWYCLNEDNKHLHGKPKKKKTLRCSEKKRKLWCSLNINVFVFSEHPNVFFFLKKNILLPNCIFPFSFVNHLDQLEPSYTYKTFCLSANCRFKNSFVFSTLHKHAFPQKQHYRKQCEFKKMAFEHKVFFSSFLG